MSATHPHPRPPPRSRSAGRSPTTSLSTSAGAERQDGTSRSGGPVRPYTSGPEQQEPGPVSERATARPDARDFCFDRPALLALADRERRSYAEARPWRHLVLHDLVP